MKKIKILIYGMSGGMGGIEKYLYNLAQNCDYTKYDLYFLDTQPNGIIYQDELQSLGCKIVKLTPSNINVTKCFKELRKIMKENEFDYVYINASMFTRFHFIVRMTKSIKTKMILHCHGTKLDASLSVLAKMLHNIGSMYFNNIKVLRVACGIDAGKFLFKKKSFEVFDNGIEIEKFEYNQSFRNEIREELGVQDDEQLFGNIARITEQKNPLFLIDIFNEIHRLNANAKFVLVGDGELRNEVKERILKYALEKYVIMPGMRSDANKFYSAIDVFVLPSLYEGFAISMIEAQVSGLHCLTSNTLDLTTDITGNVEFISLEKSAREWAEVAVNCTKRDYDVIEKIPNKYKVKESCKKVFEYFEKNL